MRSISICSTARSACWPRAGHCSGALPGSLQGPWKAIPVINTDAEFFVPSNLRLLATHLFLALVLIELSDIIFAVDSIPAIFAVTSDPFIVLTSNIFARLDSAPWYSLLADFLVRLKYLRVGLALVLVFVGTKMLVASVYKIPVLVSLGAVATLLGASAIASLFRPRVGWGSGLNSEQS